MMILFVVAQIMTAVPHVAIKEHVLSLILVSNLGVLTLIKVTHAQKIVSVALDAVHKMPATMLQNVIPLLLCINKHGSS